MSDTWAEWTADNPDADEADKLAALRTFIFEEAKHRINTGDIDAAWANKKLNKLGITDRIITKPNAYTLKVPVTAVLEMVVYATNRDEALQKTADLLATNGGNRVSQISGDANAAVFIAGPEDVPTTAPDSAPTTVDATLSTLREVILLGNIAGPRFDCESGVNRVLADFGLDPIPPRKQFTVGVPVEGIMKTTITAYDEASAKRVAAWRWNNGQTGFDLDHVSDTDVLAVTEVVA